MTASPSIVRAVVRDHVRALLLEALAIVLVGTVVAAVAMVARDDAAALAQARTLGSELDNHAADPPSELDVLVRHELEEQRWFLRRTEVYRAGDRVGGTRAAAALERWAAAPDGCSLATLEGAVSRICVLHAARSTTFVIASPLAPVLASLAPVVAAVSLVTLLSAAVFATLGARSARRRLAPLSRFERAIADLPPLGAERSVPAAWGAAEVDTLAAAFDNLLRRIDVAVERERRFVADAAHELRTPLTRLRGQIDLALGEIEEGASPAQRLSAASRSCAELGRTTDALLALARDEIFAGETLDLTDLARAQSDAFESAEISRVSVETEGGEALVRGDEPLLSLALRNLVDNALKYSGGPVLVQVASTEAAARVLVADRGPGIPEVELARVSEPFVRGRMNRDGVRGTGLGLALVRHVATLHGGSLSLRNRPGGGLEAEVRLPPWRARTLASR